MQRNRCCMISRRKGLSVWEKIKSVQGKGEGVLNSAFLRGGA